MNIKEDTYEPFFEVKSPRMIIGVLVLTILSIGISYFVSIRYGILSSTLILCYIGILSTNSWHNELVKDGYAPISNLYSGYFSAVFLFFGVTPILFLIIDSLISIIIGFVITLIYSSIISGIAFRGIDENERKSAFNTYKGPSVIYLDDGPYIEHTEEVSLSDRA